jgi:uncharacterized glyoxalase superfamily protein PhnB
MIPPRLSFVTLAARNVPNLRAFYRGFGWQESEHSHDGYAAFRLGSATLAVYPVEELSREAAPGEALPQPGQWNGMTLAINVDAREEVDATFASAISCGAGVVSTPTDRPWGGRSGYVADPEGNRWEIAWAPGWDWPLDNADPVV